MNEVIVPDVAGEIVAWRAWNLVSYPQPHYFTPYNRDSYVVQLDSLTHGTRWAADDWTYARCGNHADRCRRSKDKRIPGEKCSCGLYAARDRSHLLSLGYASSLGKVVVGQVGLAGKVIPGEQGWRAQKGRIIRIFLPIALARLAETIEHTYAPAQVVVSDIWANAPRFYLAPAARGEGWLVMDRIKSDVLGWVPTHDQAKSIISQLNGGK